MRPVVVGGLRLSSSRPFVLQRNTSASYFELRSSRLTRKTTKSPTTRNDSGSELTEWCRMLAGRASRCAAGCLSCPRSHPSPSPSTARIALTSQDRTGLIFLLASQPGHIIRSGVEGWSALRVVFKRQTPLKNQNSAQPSLLPSTSSPTSLRPINLSRRMVLLPQAPTPATKAKTEAKARYLKKKKEKSKKRKQAAIDSAPKGKKAAASSTSQTPAAASTVGDAEVDSSDEEETAVEGVQVETEAVEDAVMEEEPKEEQDDSSRKRKKRRTSAEEEKDDDDDEDNQSVAGPSEHSPEPASFDLDSLPLEPFPHQPPLVPEPTADLLHPLTVPHALTTARVISFSHTVPLPEISSSTSSDLVPISSRVLQRLKDLQISSFFAVQTAVIPFLLPPPIDSPNGASTVAGLYPLFKQRDVCVSAPTGSGKTLSYVVPIVEVLQKRVVTRLRALVILPTRDLVSQTRETFEAVAKGTGLKVRWLVRVPLASAHR